MPLHIIIGTQWGDEGKGRVVDCYAGKAQFTARFNGGDNAGHTVTVGERIFKLHLVPSGIIQPNVVAVMGNGMAINPRTLLEEIEELRQTGVSISPQRLHLSHAAHLITPAHQALDSAQEARRGNQSLGTTGRGIGPAYADKSSRTGLRVADMLRPDFGERIADSVAEANRQLRVLNAANVGDVELEPAAICAAYRGYAVQLKDYITDTSLELDSALRSGKLVLAEGAQGTLLDIDHGTYPFVTSSSTVAASALTGLGLGLSAARQARVSGVVKAFQTRVGSGPFPSEVSGALAKRLRGSGEQPWDEFGTTTGRPRRVGWLDAVLLRYAARINGLTELAVTKLDILSGIERLKVCIAYKAGGDVLHDLPFGPADLNPYQPVYEEHPGWEEDLREVRHWDELPLPAKRYLERIAELCDLPVRLVSIGPERGQMIEIDPAKQ